MNPTEFAQKIRAKYPGAYDKVPDDILTQKVIAKYPVYASQVKMSEPIKETKPTLFSDLGTLYGGGEQGIANKLKTDIQEGAKDIQQGFQSGTVGGAITGVVKGTTKAALRTAGDVAGTVFAPVATGLNIATGGTLNKFFEHVQKTTEAGEGPVGEVVSKLSDNPTFQKFAMEHPNVGEDFSRFLNLIFAKAETGKIEPSTVIPRTVKQFKGVSIRPTADIIAQERRAKLNQGFEEQNTRLKTVDRAFNKNTINRTNAEGKSETITPIDTFSKYDIAPNIDKGSIQMGDYRTGTGELGKIKAEVERLDNTIDSKLENTGQKISLERLRQDAVNRAKTNEEFKREGSVSSNVKKVEARFDDYATSYGEQVDIAELNNIRKVANKDYAPDTQDTSRIVGDTARDYVHNATPNAEIKGLLQQQGELLSAKRYAEAINGTKVVGGRLGNLALRTTGAIIGTSLQSFPLLGPLVGAIGGEYLARILQQAQFKSAWTELRALIQRSNSSEQTIRANTTANTGAIPKDTTILSKPVNPEGGYIKNPLIKDVTKNIPKDDLATMSDFTDYVAGSYKPPTKIAQQLELDASRIAEKYNIGEFKTTQGLANQFGRVLEDRGFGKRK